MHLHLPTGGIHIELIRAPAVAGARTREEIAALVRAQIGEVGFEAHSQALAAYGAYPLLSLAWRGAALVGYHGMAVTHHPEGWVANLGSLYVAPGQPRGLGQLLIALSLLPSLIRQPSRRLVWYTLTRSPRVVAAGRRWLHPFWPDPRGAVRPPPEVLALVERDLARRGEALDDRELLTLRPPDPSLGWRPRPLPERAWSGDLEVDTFMRRALGPEGDRRVLVMGQANLRDVGSVFARYLYGAAVG